MNTIVSLCMIVVIVTGGALRLGRRLRVVSLLAGAGAGFLCGMAAVYALFLRPHDGGAEFIRDAGRATQVLRATLDDARDDMPSILIVGTSHSARGIDPAIVESVLEEKGYRRNVMLMALGGMSMLEQDYYIDELLNRMKKPPDDVFLEVSKRYENPIREYISQRMVDRVLASSDAARLLWAARFAIKNMVSGHDTALMWNGLQGIAEIAVFRFMNIGAMPVLKPVRDILPEKQEFFSGREPASAKNPVFEFRQVQDWVHQGSGEIPAYELPEQEQKWVSGFRAWQEDKLAKRGVRMAFHAPPMIPDDYTAYASAICGLMKAECIAMTGQEARSLLDGDVWYNVTHLNRGGAEVYSRWLGEQLAEYLDKNKKGDMP